MIQDLENEELAMAISESKNTCDKGVATSGHSLEPGLFDATDMGAFSVTAAAAGEGESRSELPPSIRATRARLL